MDDSHRLHHNDTKIQKIELTYLFFLVVETLT